MFGVIFFRCDIGLTGFEDNVLDNDKLKVDFQPLYQCIHIYTTLDSLDELRKSYQADRKVCCFAAQYRLLLTLSL